MKILNIDLSFTNNGVKNNDVLKIHPKQKGGAESLSQNVG